MFSILIMYSCIKMMLSSSLGKMMILMLTVVLAVVRAKPELEINMHFNDCQALHILYIQYVINNTVS